MMIHEANHDEYVYEHDKPVFVRSYSRVRFGEIESVRQHFRSYPNC